MSNIIIKNGEITSSNTINLCGTQLIFGSSSNNSNFNFKSINDDKFNFTGSINYKNINSLNDYLFVFKTKKLDDFTSSKNDNVVGNTHTNIYASGTLFYSESIGLNFINTNSSSVKLGGVLFASYEGNTLQNFYTASVNLFTGSYNYSATIEDSIYTSSVVDFTGFSQSGIFTSGYFSWNFSSSGFLATGSHNNFTTISNRLFLTSSGVIANEIKSNIGTKNYHIDSLIFNSRFDTQNINTSFSFTELKIANYKDTESFKTNNNISTQSYYVYGTVTNPITPILQTSSFNKDLDIFGNLGYIDSMSIILNVKMHNTGGAGEQYKRIQIDDGPDPNMQIQYTVFNNDIPFVSAKFFGNDKIYNPLEFFKNVNMLKFKVNGNIYFKSSTIVDGDILFHLSSSFNIEKYNNSDNLTETNNISYFVENKKNEADEFDSTYANLISGSYLFSLDGESVNEGITNYSDYYNLNKVPYNIDFILLNKGITGNSVNFFTKGNFYHSFGNILSNFVEVDSSVDNKTKGTWYQSSSSLVNMANVNYIKFNFNFKSENVISKISSLYISTDNVIVETY